MSRIHVLKGQKADRIKAALAALDTAQKAAQAENKPLSPEAIVADDAAHAAIAALDEEIRLETRRIEAEASLLGTGTTSTGTVTVEKPNADKDKKRGFASPREFLLAAMANSGLRSRDQVRDERLKPLAQADKDDQAAAGELAFMLPSAFTPRSLMATVGSDEQGEYSDPYGGFAITATRLPGILSIGFEGDPTTGLTQSIPMASPTVELLARTDKTHTTSVSGGFTVARKAETAAAAASRGEMELVTLKAASVFGLAYATEEILADSPVSFVAIIETGLREQFGAYMLNEKLRGLGGNQYTGIISAACTVSVAAEANQAADTIKADNVIKMAAQCWGYGSAVWLANHDTRHQLMTMFVSAGTGGQLLYVPGSGFPDTLLGRPIYYTEYASKLGDVGDLILANFSQYLEGLYQPLQGAESMHVRFLNHERAFKFWLRNAGAPWWRSALTPAKSSVTLSPFVTLAAR